MMNDPFQVCRIIVHETMSVAKDKRLRRSGESGTQWRAKMCCFSGRLPAGWSSLGAKSKIECYTGDSEIEGAIIIIVAQLTHRRQLHTALDRLLPSQNTKKLGCKFIVRSADPAEHDWGRLPRDLRT